MKATGVVRRIDDLGRVVIPKEIRKKVCPLCSDKNLVLDYKNADQLKRYINDKGKILPRRATGACAKHQRTITLAIKRARHIAVLPFTQN